ncbi:hypothetical protein GGR57DRAFT_251084 [Xylariaceae sp. FL1272]|nr:hypothetical protein GGR57DRAFT_251084 [Xylariaceae sp. FL1272]
MPRAYLNGPINDYAKGMVKLLTNQQLRDTPAGIPPTRNAGINVSWQSLWYLDRTGLNKTESASHLYALSVCSNPSHMVDKSLPLNLPRRGCLGGIWCLIHEHLVLDLCTHGPPKCVTPKIRSEPYLRTKKVSPFKCWFL